MGVFETIRQVVADILDMEEKKILMETYLIRDLGAESIDLLELAVSLNGAFQIEVRDDDIFLRKLRVYLEEAKEKQQDRQAFLMQRYPFLEDSRIQEIVKDLDGGAVLKISDLVRYVTYQQHHAG